MLKGFPWGISVRARGHVASRLLLENPELEKRIWAFRLDPPVSTEKHMGCAEKHITYSMHLMVCGLHLKVIQDKDPDKIKFVIYLLHKRLIQKQQNPRNV